MAIAVPSQEIRGKRFDRVKPSRLVNLESYGPYLVDEPEDVPLWLPFNNQGPWVHQHIYFPEAAYRQDGIPEEEKDLFLNWMRRISYNQIIMRRYQEKKLHPEMETIVAPPPPETVRQNLKDFAHVDIIGSAAMGRLVTLHPAVHRMFLAHAGELSAELRGITPNERLDHFDKLIEQSLDALDKTLITPRIVLSSALKRMGQLLGDSELESEADIRLRDEDTYYPLRMPKIERLFSLSNNLLGEDQNLVAIVQPPELAQSQALQTEAETVELQAA